MLSDLENIVDTSSGRRRQRQVFPHFQVSLLFLDASEALRLRVGAPLPLLQGRVRRPGVNQGRWRRDRRNLGRIVLENIPRRFDRLEFENLLRERRLCDTDADADVDVDGADDDGRVPVGRGRRLRLLGVQDTVDRNTASPAVT